MAFSPSYRMAEDRKLEFRRMLAERDVLVHAFDAVCKAGVDPYSDTCQRFQADQKRLEDEIVHFILKYATLNEPAVPSARSERVANIDKIATMLFDYLFAMVARHEDGEFLKRCRDELNGNFIAQQCGIRKNSVGTILDLKFRGGEAEETPQLLYRLIKEPELFAVLLDYEAHYGPSARLGYNQFTLRLATYLQTR